MAIGRQIRLSRILNNGKMLCIPMDHGITNGPIPGLEDVYGFIYRCENSGVTSVIINKGIIKSLPRPPKVGLIAHLSASTSLGLSPNKKVQMGGVEDAIRLGADGISVHINIGANLIRLIEPNRSFKRHKKLINRKSNGERRFLFFGFLYLLPPQL